MAQEETINSQDEQQEAAQASSQAQDDDYIVIPRALLLTVGVSLVTLVVGGLLGYFLALMTIDRSVEAAVSEAVASAPQTAAGNAQAVAPAQPTQPPARVDNVSVDDDPALGPENAEVVIVEFSDFR